MHALIPASFQYALLQPFVDFFDVFTTAAATAATLTPFVLVDSHPAFSDPVGEQTTYGIRLQVKMQGYIV
jgi:hypothetical protein